MIQREELSVWDVNKIGRVVPARKKRKKEFVLNTTKDTQKNDTVAYLCFENQRISVLSEVCQGVPDSPRATVMLASLLLYSGGPISDNRFFLFKYGFALCHSNFNKTNRLGPSTESRGTPKENGIGCGL